MVVSAACLAVSAACFNSCHGGDRVQAMVARLAAMVVSAAHLAVSVACFSLNIESVWLFFFLE